MENGRVIFQASLGEYFHHQVTEARAELGIRAAPETELYLVNLLCDYGRIGERPVPGEEPLAFMYQRATEASGAERARRLKDLGDVALYVAGFFADFIERSLVDIDYYVSMGGSAYGSLSHLVGRRRHGEVFVEIYLQLAHRFAQFVDLLTEVAERTRATFDDHAALLKLYDRWARTKSERIHKLLIERGLLPTEGLPTEYSQ